MTNTATTIYRKIYEKNTNKVILYETFVNNESRSVHLIPLSEITHMVMKQQKLTIRLKTDTLNFIGTQDELDILYDRIQKNILYDKED